MKILFISMPSIHVTRWIENLNDSENELFWFDIMDRGNLNTNKKVFQYTPNYKRKRKPIKGEYFLSKKTPEIYSLIQPFLEFTPNEILENIIGEIQPDIIHSFKMQSCSYPILKTMKKFPQIKWIYSCWGSDLFYYQSNLIHKLKIKEVLKRVNLIHTDCNRDYELAKSLGFKGDFSGVIPGGSGYDLELVKEYIKPISNRRIILVKGYEHQFGRAINVIKAIEGIERKVFEKYEIVVFGAHQKVIDYIKNNNFNCSYYTRHELNNFQILELMGSSLIYIGNSISDGIPNTLIESIIMGAFPIQSNPGYVTQELITHEQTGLLINDPENITEISKIIHKAIINPKLMENASKKNSIIADERFDQNKINVLINNLYKNTKI